VNKFPILDEIEVPHQVVNSWQETIDLLAEITDVPAALIMRVNAREIEMFSSYQSAGNVYHCGETMQLGTGLYCETDVTQFPLSCQAYFTSGRSCSFPPMHFHLPNIFAMKKMTRAPTRHPPPIMYISEYPAAAKYNGIAIAIICVWDG